MHSQNLNNSPTYNFDLSNYLQHQPHILFEESQSQRHLYQEGQLQNREVMSNNASLNLTEPASTSREQENMIQSTAEQHFGFQSTPEENKSKFEHITREEETSVEANKNNQPSEILREMMTDEKQREMEVSDTRFYHHLGVNEVEKPEITCKDCGKVYFDFSETSKLEVYQDQCGNCKAKDITHSKDNKDKELEHLKQKIQKNTLDIGRLKAATTRKQNSNAKFKKQIKQLHNKQREDYEARIIQLEDNDHNQEAEINAHTKEIRRLKKFKKSLEEQRKVEEAAQLKLKAQVRSFNKLMKKQSVLVIEKTKLLLEKIENFTIKEVNRKELRKSKPKRVRSRSRSRSKSKSNERKSTGVGKQNKDHKQKIDEREHRRNDDQTRNRNDRKHERDQALTHQSKSQSGYHHERSIVNEEDNLGYSIFSGTNYGQEEEEAKSEKKIDEEGRESGCEIIIID